MRSAPWAGRACLAGLLLAAAGLPVLYGLIAPDAARDLAARLAGLGPMGALLLVLLQAVVAAVGVLPASLVGVAAGALFGASTGFALSALGTMAGAVATFAFARGVLRPGAAARLGGGRLAHLDRALAREGWRLVCLIRLSPVMPFAPTSLALGASAVGLRDYLLGTLAALPALFAYVALGAAGRGGGLAVSGGSAEWLRLALLLAGGPATLVLTLRLRRLLARRTGAPPLGQDLPA